MYIKKYKSATIKGKLRVCNYLSKHGQLKRYIPATVSFTWPNLRKMSYQYKSVYIKLDIGSMGVGVYKMNREFIGYSLYITDKKKHQTQKYYKQLSDVYKYIKSENDKNMIIQKDILLDQVNGRPYDIRVMVQRKPGKSWTCTGFLVKVGAPERIVTNYYQGGKIYTINKLYAMKGYSESQKEQRTKHLTQNALKTANYLSKKRPGMHEMGIDYAYDWNDQLWILEVNSNHPQFYPLKKINRSMYNRMKSFAISYGRKDQ